MVCAPVESGRRGIIYFTEGGPTHGHGQKQRTLQRPHTRHRLGDPAKKKKPANIFVCSMADLFGNWIPEEWIEAVFEACKAAPQHNYLFLTKNPGRYQALAAAGKLPELPNFWYGSSITGPENSFWWSEYHNTFVSYEPMLKPLGIADEDSAAKVDWIIAGAETGHRTGKITPEEGWLEELAAAHEGQASRFGSKTARRSAL